MLAYALKNKAMAEPSNAEVLKEQALQVEATTEAILNNAEEMESASETLAQKGHVEVGKAAEATYPVNLSMVPNSISDLVLNSSYPQSETHILTPHQ